MREVLCESIDDAVGMALTLMPHIAAKATISDPFLLPRDNEGKPACASGRRHCSAASAMDQFWRALSARSLLATLAGNRAFACAFRCFRLLVTFTPPFTGFPRHA